MSHKKNHTKTLPLTKKTLPLTKKDVETDKNVIKRSKSIHLSKNLTLDDKLWEVSESFIDQYGLVSMHLDSFNCAIEEMIPKIVEEKGKISLVRNGQTHKVDFTNMVFTSPVHKNDSGLVTESNPKMCMDLSISYSSGIYLDIIYKGPNNQYNKYEKKYIGDIYVPVYSNLCNLSKIKGDKYQLAALEEDINDLGGYYILKGSQKVIVPQVRPSHNNIHIYTGKAVSTNSKPKFSKYTETRCGGLTSHITTVQVGICIKSGLVSVSIPYIDSCSIPLGILFCALGLKNSKEISSFVFEKKWYIEPPTPKHKIAILVLVKSLEQSWSILNDKNQQRVALHYIGTRSKKGTNKPHNQTLSQKDLEIEYEQIVTLAKMLLSIEFLPHIGTGENYNIEKCIFLGYMVRKLLLCHVGILPVSDRDHTANKRIHTSGMIMAAHFYKAFCQLTGKIVSCIDGDIKKNKPVNISSYITQPHIITTSFTSALMANKWNTGPVQGISQTIDNFNFVSTLSFLRKFIIPMANDGGKIEPPRHLHGSQWGTSCVTGDTLITLADSSLVEMKELDNRAVMSVNPVTLKNEPTNIFNNIVISDSELLLIEDDEGKTIKCTKDHPFLVYEKGVHRFVPAENLRVGYNLTCMDSGNNLYGHINFRKDYNRIIIGEQVYITKIINIVKLGFKDTVYDFTTVSKNHTFISNGFITHNCPYETPEGKKVGLVQILPTCAIVTVGCDHRPVIEFLRDMNIIGMNELVGKKEGDLYDMNNFLSNTRIFVNGIPQGCTKFPEEVVSTLIGLRRKCNLNPFISIAHDHIDKEIRISTDAGRSCRGLVTLKNGEISIPEQLLDEMRQNRLGHHSANLKFTSEKSVWMYLLENGYVEIIDKDEEENLNVAIYPSDLASMPISTRIQYTHCEMTPDMIEGIGANTSPKNDCNQAPRNIYQAAMAKQAIGSPGLNHLFHRKSKWHSLVYPQKPIINTRIARKVGLDNVPMGQNATVLVMPWYGYNQEDSLVINKNAVERGFMCSYAYVAHEAVIKNLELPGSVKFETFEIPKKEECNDYRGNPSKLIKKDQWCYVPEGIEVEKGDILIGMTIKHAANARYVNSSIYTKNKTNISIIYDQKWPAVVHSVLCGKNGDGYMCIKIVTRQYRKPVRGDKFAARHGQKGTVGELLDSRDMPFLTRLGYTPNILLNPLAFPSRMTIGALIEAVMGISLSASALKCPEYHMPLCLDGKSDNDALCITKDLGKKDYKYPDGFDPYEDYKMCLDGDASPFVKSFDRDYVLECIKKLGVPGFCEEEVMNPQTGKKLKVLIFSGVVYYQRLRHMVVDKIHARSTGSHHGLHRQPTEGRKKKGGFRIGHMERDNLSGDSRIFLREGFSVRIATLGKKFENVWGWNAENDGLEKSKQVNFGIGKSRTVYAMTLQDGRVIKGSRNHPFYTEDNTYSDMKDLVVNKDRLACSILGPLVDFEEDMILCKNWTWDDKFFQSIHEKKISLSGYEVFRKSLRLARLMGLVSTDGLVSSDKDSVLVFPDHLIDLRSVVDDIYDLTGLKPKAKSIEKVRYSVEIPLELSKAVKKMGVISGKRVKQESYFPTFINENTPLPILREFLGGLFGGDGHTVCISIHREKRDLMKSVSFSWTRDVENLESLQKNMEFLQKLLLRFEIESSIHAPKQTTASKKSYDRYMHKEIPLVIPLHCLVKFSEKIGFRYCEHKSLRLSAGVSYRMFREGVLRQRLWICEKVDELVNYREKKNVNPKCIVLTKKAIETAVEELKSTEVILHDKSIPTGKIVGRILTEKNNNELRCEGFPTIDEYLTDTRAIDFFDDCENTSAKCCIPKESKFVPAYYLRVIDIRKTDQEEDMYDITVEGNESYVANGIVSHNCMLAQGIPEMVQDRLLYQSDVYKMPVCQVCGLAAIDDGKNVYCRLCQTSKIVTVQLPFGTKLFSQEFSVLNLVPRMITLPEPK